MLHFFLPFPVSKLFPRYSLSSIIAHAQDWEKQKAKLKITNIVSTWHTCFDRDMVKLKTTCYPTRGFDLVPDGL